jgi:hypothetical protein
VPGVELGDAAKFSSGQAVEVWRRGRWLTAEVLGHTKVGRRSMPPQRALICLVTAESHADQTLMVTDPNSVRTVLSMPSTNLSSS